jgi:hypothetical protein
MAETRDYISMAEVQVQQLFDYSLRGRQEAAKG